MEIDSLGTDPERLPVLDRKERIIALLPGSRMGEIQRILPRLLKAVTLIAKGQAPNGDGGTIFLFNVQSSKFKVL